MECTYQVEDSKKVIPAGMVILKDEEVGRQGEQEAGYERRFEIQEEQEVPYKKEVKERNEE